MWRRSSVAWGVVTSLALHGAWISTLRPERPARRSEAAAPLAFEVEMEALQRGVQGHAAQRLAPDPVIPGGPRSESALDQDARSGKGGDGASLERPAMLFSFVSPLSLQDTDLNNLDVSQTQRIETARSRATQEERRATPNAADAVFLASGSKGHAERRKPARVDASQGAPERTSDLRQGEARAVGVGVDPQQQASTAPPDARSASQDVMRGIQRGSGARESLSARVMLARPNVDRGPAATPAETLDSKIRDNMDAELLAASLQRSIVDSSTQRAAQNAAGQGGVASIHPQAIGLQGEGSGARALPYLPGSGNASALDTSDARYIRWFTEQKERVQNEVVFPRPRALAKDQGISIYRIVVRRDGRLSGAPYLVRSSGFSDFDQAAVVAIRRAVPFSPLPERLAPQASDLTLLIPVAFSNPMVQ